jgi:hypothetical protein
MHTHTLAHLHTGSGTVNVQPYPHDTSVFERGSLMWDINEHHAARLGAPSNQLSQLNQVQHAAKATSVTQDTRWT